MNNLETLPNLRRAKYARFGYENQYEDLKDDLPPWPTRLGRKVDPTEKVLGSEELLLSKLKRESALDVWTPIIKLYYSKRDILIFKGEEAEKLWTAWKGIVYNSK